MAKFSVEFIPERQALLLTEYADFKLGTDGKDLTEAIKRAFGQYHDLCFVVVDSRASTFSFDDLLVGVNHVAKELTPLPLRAFVIVSSNLAKQAAAKGMQHDIFGHIPSASFSTMEEAFNYIDMIRD